MNRFRHPHHQDRPAIEGGVQWVTQQLGGRVKELEREVVAFSEKVEKHLKKMGVAWA